MLDPWAPDLQELFLIMTASPKLLERLPSELQKGGLSGSLDPKGYTGEISGIGRWQIFAFAGPERLNLDLFCCVPLRVPFTGQNQVVAVHFQGNTRTLGYIYPLSSLRSDSTHEDRWQAIYATAASDFVVLDGRLNEVVAPLTPEALLQGVEVADLIDSQYGVLVLGNEQLTQLNATIEEVTFSLQSVGIKLIPRSSQGSQAPRNVAEYSRRIGIRRVAESLLPDVETLAAVASAAGHQENQAFRFLLLYQAFEIFIGKVFHSHLKDLVQAWESNRDDWAFRDDVAKAANEKHRLRILSTKFVNEREKGTVEMQLMAACRGFATMAQSLNIAEKDDWVDGLYAIRNLVVHRQAEMLVIDHEKLVDVCDSLSALIHVFAAGFDVPPDVDA